MGALHIIGKPGFKPRLKPAWACCGDTPTLTAEDLQPARSTDGEIFRTGDCLGKHGRGKPQRWNCSYIDATERFSGDADDGELIAIDQQRSADDIGRTAISSFQVRTQ